jgi:hypothetical protein
LGGESSFIRTAGWMQILILLPAFQNKFPEGKLRADHAALHKVVIKVKWDAARGEVGYLVMNFKVIDTEGATYQISVSLASWLGIAGTVALRGSDRGRIEGAKSCDPPPPV